MQLIHAICYGAADRLDGLVADLGAVRGELLAVLAGQTAAAAERQFALLFDGVHSVGRLADALRALGDLAGIGGTDIEHAKLSLISALGWASGEISWLLANAEWTAGASTTLIPVVEQATSTAIRHTAATLMERLADAVGSMLTRTMVHRLVEGGAEELVQGTLEELTIQ